MRKYTSLIKHSHYIDDEPASKRLKRSVSADHFNLKSNPEIILNSSQPASYFGEFGKLPLELQFHLFGYVPIRELGILSTSSKQLRTLIELYTNSVRCKQLEALNKRHLNERDTLNNLRKDEFISVYKEIGTFYKRITSLYSTAIRINILEKILKQHICEYVYDPCCYQHCPSLLLFGYLLKSLTNGWQLSEKNKLFHSLVHTCFGSNFWKKLTSLINKQPGTTPCEELIVRIFLRRVFLDPYIDTSEGLCNYEDLSFSTQSIKTCVETLALIVKKWPYVHQARILFILYGPLHRGALMWRAMCENTAANAEQVHACFGELGASLSLLHHFGYWSDNDVTAVLDEMTCLPDDWLAENVACLMYTCGQSLMKRIMAVKGVCGRPSELAVTLTSLCLVQVKVRGDLRSVVQLVEQACDVASSRMDKKKFLDQLAQTFQDVIIDLYESDEIENRLEDFSTLLRAQANFVRALLGRVYEE